MVVRRETPRAAWTRWRHVWLLPDGCFLTAGTVEHGDRRRRASCC